MVSQVCLPLAQQMREMETRARKWAKAEVGLR